MKILLTGCDDQVGWAISRKAPNCNFDGIATDIHNLNITDIEAFRSLQAEKQVDIIINSTAYTAVDKAEVDIGISWPSTLESLVSPRDAKLPTIRDHHPI